MLPIPSEMKAEHESERPKRTQNWGISREKKTLYIEK